MPENAILGEILLDLRISNNRTPNNPFFAQGFEGQSKLIVNCPFSIINCFSPTPTLSPSNFSYKKQKGQACLSPTSMYTSYYSLVTSHYIISIASPYE